MSSSLFWFGKGFRSPGFAERRRLEVELKVIFISERERQYNYSQSTSLGNGVSAESGHGSLLALIFLALVGKTDAAIALMYFEASSGMENLPGEKAKSAPEGVGSSVRGALHSKSFISVHDD